MTQLIKEKKLCISNINWKVQVLRTNYECVTLIYYINSNKFHEHQMSFELYSDMFSYFISMYSSEDEIFFLMIEEAKSHIINQKDIVN